MKAGRDFDKNCPYTCSECGSIGCRNHDTEKYPPFCLTANADRELLKEVVGLYKNDEQLGKIARASACIEGEFYGRMCRVEETIEFIRRMDYQKIGIATCVGLLGETKIFTKILEKNKIKYYTVGCKVGAVDKTEIGIPNEKKSTAAAA
jgi:uncharacterized metal-binding protein